MLCVCGWSEQVDGLNLGTNRCCLCYFKEKLGNSWLWSLTWCSGLSYPFSFLISVLSLVDFWHIKQLCLVCAGFFHCVLSAALQSSLVDYLSSHSCWSSSFPRDFPPLALGDDIFLPSLLAWVPVVAWSPCSTFSAHMHISKPGWVESRS